MIHACYAHTIAIVMATMTIRTTVAFDPATVARWERLAKRWGVSKSEALRRVLEAAEANESSTATGEPDFSAMSPIEIMDWLRDHPQVPPGWGNAFRAELKAARKHDAEIEEERERRKQSLAAKLASARP